MEVYILRHAIAEEHDADKYPDDSLRPLTVRGKKRMRRVAEGMSAAGVRVDIIYTSPYTRARQTADIVADVYHARKKLHETKTLASDGDPGELINLLQTMKGKVNRVLLVGHEPYLSDLISVLVTGDSGFTFSMKKGGLCKLAVDAIRFGKCASMEFLLPPSVSVHLA